MGRTCRACHSNKLLHFFDLKKIPIGHKLLDNADEASELFDLDLVICEDCGVIQITNPIDPEILYGAFNYNFSSWKQEPHQQSEVDEILKLGPFTSVIDIGCNDGFFLKALSERGVGFAVGIEPNPVPAERCRDRGFTVVNRMLDESMCQDIVNEHGHFDLLVCRQVLEHLIDIDLFFRCVDILLSQSGVLFIDVPDFEPALGLGDCSMLWEEHVSHFTASTLANLISAHGFEPASIRKYNFSGGTLAVASMRKSAASDTSNAKAEIPNIVQRANQFESSANLYGARINAALNRVRAKGFGTVMYGVGGRGCIAANVHGFGDKIDFVVDDQPERIGKFMPGACLPIRPTANLIEVDWPQICVLAVGNENESKVKERLLKSARSPIKFASIFGPTDIWLELETLEKI